MPAGPTQVASTLAGYGGSGAPDGSLLDRRLDDGLYTEQVTGAVDPITGYWSDGSIGNTESCTFAEHLMNECGDSVALAALTLRGGLPAAAFGWGMARLYGLLGERAVARALDLPRNYDRISNTLSGTNRIPDFWSTTARTIYEVKNVASLSWNAQVRDMAVWAKTNNHTFELWYREGATLSAELVREAQVWGVRLVAFNPWE
jgi:hypothetical protein